MVRSFGSFSLFVGVDAKDFGNFEGGNGELLWIAWVKPFHPAGKFQGIARRLASETLKNVAGKVNRQARRSRRSIGAGWMAGQWARGGHTVALPFDINRVVTQNILESELAAKLLEIDPCGHGLRYRALCDHVSSCDSGIAISF